MNRQRFGKDINMGKTKIEWTNHTINPVVGCSKASPGCLSCYGERMAWRLKCMGHEKYQAVVDANGWTGKIGYDMSVFEKLPKKPSHIFVCSMGDLFHKDVPFQEILTIFDIMHQCPQHTFMILTKRPQRMLEFCSKYGLMPDRLGLTGSGQTWPENVWCGVSAENQERANERIPVLLQIPSPIKFVSIEPMLGPIDLSTQLNYLDWVIVGGESGSNARPIHPEWVTKIRDDCIEKNVPFFFKSWGQWIPHNPAHGGPYFSENIKAESSLRRCKWRDGREMKAQQDRWCKFLKVGKKYSGRVLDGKVWDQYPLFNK